MLVSIKWSLKSITQVFETVSFEESPTETAETAGGGVST